MCLRYSRTQPYTVHLGLKVRVIRKNDPMGMAYILTENAG